MADIYNMLLILRTPKIGPVKYAQLVQQFGSVDAAAAMVCDASVRDSVLREMDLAQKLGIKYISDDDAAYPDNLRAVKNHPPVLSVRGNIDALRKRIVSMVGTRHATAAGMEFMGQIAADFVRHGFAVSSGMAIGTDAAAHRGALSVSGDAQTIAVLAGGADYIWPIENESLYWEIVARGAVISEMPVGYTPLATNFVQRNRWVAGICETLIVGEADTQSGSMRTARFANEIGREIYAIPSHPSDSRAAGPNSLIKSGAAKLCDSANMFFHDDKNRCQNKKITKNSSDENSLLDLLGNVPVSESVLAQLAKKSISSIKRELVMFELQGLVRKTDNGYVRV